MKPSWAQETARMSRRAATPTHARRETLRGRAALLTAAMLPGEVAKWAAVIETARIVME